MNGQELIHEEALEKIGSITRLFLRKDTRGRKPIIRKNRLPILMPGNMLCPDDSTVMTWTGNSGNVRGYFYDFYVCPKCGQKHIQEDSLRSTDLRPPRFIHPSA